MVKEVCANAKVLLTAYAPLPAVVTVTSVTPPEGPITIVACAPVPAPPVNGTLSYVPGVYPAPAVVILTLKATIAFTVNPVPVPPVG